MMVKQQVRFEEDNLLSYIEQNHIAIDILCLLDTSQLTCHEKMDNEYVIEGVIQNAYLSVYVFIMIMLFRENNLYLKRMTK